MENQEKMMTGEESLHIITEMINRTKGNIRQASFHILFWGWLLFVCSISEYLFHKFTNWATPWYVWFLVIPGIFVSLIYGYVSGRRLKIFTYASMVYMWTWLAFLIAGTVIFIVTSKDPEVFPPLILSLAGMATLISGVIIRFRPLIAGSITFWIFALTAYFGGPDIESLSVSVAMLTGYLIPGYLLKRKENNNEIQRA